jgi:hypothetical protein
MADRPSHAVLRLGLPSPHSVASHPGRGSLDDPPGFEPRSLRQRGGRGAECLFEGSRKRLAAPAQIGTQEVRYNFPIKRLSKKEKARQRVWGLVGEPLGIAAGRAGEGYAPASR